MDMVDPAIVSEWEGSPAKLVLAHGKSFSFIETIKFVLTEERGRKRRAFSSRTFNRISRLLII